MEQCRKFHGPENWVPRSDSGNRCRICDREKSRRYSEKSREARRIVEALSERVDVDQLMEMLSE